MAGGHQTGKAGRLKRLPLPALTVAAALAAVFCLRVAGHAGAMEHISSVNAAP
jgi:hypothetical protein